MAAVINDRDVLLQDSSNRLLDTALSPTVSVPGDVTGTLNGIPVQDVIDAANTGGGGGDITKDILENSATAIVVTSSNLFTYPGTSQAGVFVGSGGIQGRDQSGNVTFSLASSDGNAEFAGTIKAGSVIVDSVQLQGSGRSLALIDAGATGYNTAQLNSDLSSGVNSVLAGQGSNYVLNVDHVGGFVAFQHKDAVYNGTALPGSNKPAVGISSAGIAMGYNRASDGAWVNSVAITSAGDATFSGTVAADSVISNNAQVLGTGMTMQQVVDAANTGGGGGDITKDILENSATSITMTSSNLFKTTTGLGGVFIGSGGLFGKNASGVNTFSIDGTTGAASFSGNITGNSNIDITGQARFRGNTAGIALSCNDTAVANTGISVQSGTSAGNGVYATCGSAGKAIRGESQHSTGTGVWAQNSFGGTALHVSGPMTISSSALVNNLYAARAVTVDNFNGTVPGSNVTGTVSNAAVATFASTAGSANSVSGGNVSGAVATADNSNSLGGFQASSWVRIIATNSGNANASGAGFILTSTVGGVRTRAAGGNSVVIENFSDGRYKENITDESYGLSFINTLRPVQYRLKEDYRSVSDLDDIDGDKTVLSSKLYHGFIAQEVQPLISDPDDCLHQTHSDGVQGVDYMSLIAPLTKAIQELSAKVEQLETQLANQGN